MQIAWSAPATRYAAPHIYVKSYDWAGNELVLLFVRQLYCRTRKPPQCNYCGNTCCGNTMEYAR